MTFTRRNPRPRPKTRLTVPQNTGPHVKLLFESMREQRVTLEDMDWKSGVRRGTIKAWRTKNAPNLTNIEACLGVVGWLLVPVPTAKALPEALRDKLQTVAEEFGMELPEAAKALVQIVSKLDALRQRAADEGLRHAA